MGKQFVRQRKRFFRTLKLNIAAATNRAVGEKFFFKFFANQTDAWAVERRKDAEKFVFEEQHKRESVEDATYLVSSLFLPDLRYACTAIILSLPFCSPINNHTQTATTTTPPPLFAKEQSFSRSLDNRSSRLIVCVTLSLSDTLCIDPASCSPK